MKKLITKILLGTTFLASGVVAGFDYSVETFSEEASRYSDTLVSVKAKSSEDESKYITMVDELVKRRESGDEPTIEEWNSVETKIDEARAVKDTELLQKLDRFIETMDAKDKDIRDSVFEKIEQYEKAVK